MDTGNSDIMFSDNFLKTLGCSEAASSFRYPKISDSFSPNFLLRRFQASVVLKPPAYSQPFVFISNVFGSRQNKAAARWPQREKPTPGSGCPSPHPPLLGSEAYYTVISALLWHPRVLGSLFKGGTYKRTRKTSRKKLYPPLLYDDGKYFE